MSDVTRELEEWENEEWKNHETYAVYRWVTNEKSGRLQHWQDEAKKHWEETLSKNLSPTGPQSICEFARRLFANSMWGDVDEMSPLKDESIHSELLQTALSNVDWRKIAGLLLAEIIETNPPPKPAAPVMTVPPRDGRNEAKVSDGLRVEQERVVTKSQELQTSWLR